MWAEQLLWTHKAGKIKDAFGATKAVETDEVTFQREGKHGEVAQYREPFFTLSYLIIPK